MDGTIVGVGLICIMIALIAFVAYLIISDSLRYSTKNMKKYFDNIKVGGYYVPQQSKSYPSEYSPWHAENYEYCYQVIDKKDGWVMLKKSDGSYIEATVKEMIKGRYVEIDISNMIQTLQETHDK